MTTTATTKSNRTGGSIFCDGACRGNGQRGAVGGWAWAYWPGLAAGPPLRSGAARLASSGSVPATNQRAELMALLEGLRSWRAGPEGGGPVTIYTDSMYALNCASKWGSGWKRSSWKKADGGLVQNQDLIRPLVDLWQVGAPAGWKLVHVRGHTGGCSPEAYGNDWVDRAAVVAAEGPQPAVAAPVVSTAAFADAMVAEMEDVIEHVVTAPAPAVVAVTKPAPRRVGAGQNDLRRWFTEG
jgi:ribonuclease HI